MAVLVLLPLLLFTCGGDTQEPASNGNPSPYAKPSSNSNAVEPNVSSPPGSPDNFTPGLALSGITLKNDPSLLMALYLPKNYQAGNSYPLILALDPQGDGELPVKQYQSLADEFGWILAGSQSSRNGLPPQEGLRIASTTLDDLQARLPIDPQRIYLTGFSGGARVACLTAQQQNRVSGVIGCGAGYQPQMQAQPFTYYGLVGLSDFNYLEMMSLKRMLESMGAWFWITTWNGGHAWPELDVMREAWEWTTFRAMAGDKMPRDSARIEAKHKILRAATKKCMQDQCYEAHQHYLSWINGLMNTSFEEKNMQRAAQKPSYQELRHMRMKWEEEEMKLRETYQFDLQTKDVAHWQTAVKELQTPGVPGDEKSWIKPRVLGFLSLVAYSYASQSLQVNDLGSAERYIGIYALVDPPNSEHAYMRAQLKARTGDVPGAVSELEHAFVLGFRDQNRTLAEPDFVSLGSDSVFLELVEMMHFED